ncbi:MAG: hypothetical protein AAF202_06255 [Pseudomonadota bacterium]
MFVLMSPDAGKIKDWEKKMKAEGKADEVAAAAEGVEEAAAAEAAETAAEVIE